MLLDDIVREINADTVPDSFDANLIRGKLWLALNLAKISNQFDTIYVLGSWYGNMALIISRVPIEYQHIVNVEIDRQALGKSAKLAKKFGVPRMTPMLANANDLDYRRIGPQGLVINTSVTNMSGAGWFDNIPPNTRVAMLARNQDPKARNQFASVDDLAIKFPLDQIEYTGTLSDQDPQTKFVHFLVIGLK